MLTDKALRAARAQTKPYRIFDKGVEKGFGVQITPAGGVYFFLQYQSPVTGRRRYLRLGQYPLTTLAAAREQAWEARKVLDAGKDPQYVQSDKDRIRKRGTVAALIKGYTEDMERRGMRSHANVYRCLKHDVIPFIGDLPANEVEPYHIREILYRIISRGAEVHSNRTRSYLHAAFKFGIRHDNDPKRMGTPYVFNIKSNPVADVPRDASVERVGERVLDWHELRRLWLANPEELPVPVRLALQFMLATGGQRSSEILGASMDELDLEQRVWSIPYGRTKNKEWHLIPLTDLALDLISQIRALTGDRGQWLFPRCMNPDSTLAMNHDTLSIAVRKYCEKVGFEKFVPKDLRRTVKTRMGELGVSKVDRDRLQNHAKTDVSSKHYDRYDYLPEKREAIEKWCRQLENIGKGDNILPFKIQPG